MTKLREDIRNVAIIAHVDHGKTTLVDELLKQSHTLDERKELQERAMDSNDLEKERGITILAKNTAVAYNGTRINIMDTPGHADFGGEVERIMKMVDGVVLVVDAYEGTMPQTRFVLKKALEQDLVPIVVVNKIDKPSARPAEVVDEVLELFIELGADDDQLDFPVVYASAINGTSSLSDDPADQEKTMAPIFDTIIDHIPAPVDNSDEPLQFQVSLLDYNDFVGRIGIGRVFRGTVKVGDQVTLSKLDGTTKNFRVTKLFGFFGLERREIQEAKAGDLIAISGMEDIFVGETITPTDAVEALPILHIDEPTLQMTFLVNNSPFAGREGKWVTSRKVEERLQAELQTDVSLRVDPTDSPDKWTVSGRGELHLSILIETMRREGYELQVSRPEVIIKEIDGVKCEPFERVQIDTPEEYQGSVIQSLSERKGEMLDMVATGNGQTRLVFLVPARGLIGYSTEFLSMTRGYGIMNHTFDQYLPVIPGEIGGRHRGALVSIDNGKATTYSIMSIEERLQAELQTDVSLRVDPTDSPDKWTVSGRGELHLSILIETMRREGYELQVSRPEVIIKEIDGVKCEPFERVQIDTPEEYQGSVIQSLSERKGEMLDMIATGNGQTRLVFLVPARGLIGYSTEFLSMTRGYGIMNHTFDQYLPVIPGEIGGRHRGALVSIDNGKATTYSIMSIEERGTIFVNPGTEVYEGMIIGENSRENDLTVNITKAKQMTNVRSATKDQTAVIKTPRILTLEESLEFLNDDEYMEVTPESIRLRKQILNKAEREKANKKKKSAAAE